jgi:hypothetical protein
MAITSSKEEALETDVQHNLAGIVQGRLPEQMKHLGRSSVEISHNSMRSPKKYKGR